MALLVSCNWMKITENMISNSENAFGNNLSVRDNFFLLLCLYSPQDKNSLVPDQASSVSKIQIIILH